MTPRADGSQPQHVGPDNPTEFDDFLNSLSEDVAGMFVACLATGLPPSEIAKRVPDEQWLREVSRRIGQEIRFFRWLRQWGGDEAVRKCSEAQAQFRKELRGSRERLRQKFGELLLDTTLERMEGDPEWIAVEPIEDIEAYLREQGIDWRPIVAKVREMLKAQSGQ